MNMYMKPVPGGASLPCRPAFAHQGPQRVVPLPPAPRVPRQSAPLPRIAIHPKEGQSQGQHNCRIQYQQGILINIINMNCVLNDIHLICIWIGTPKPC